MTSEFLKPVLDVSLPPEDEPPGTSATAVAETAEAMLGRNNFPQMADGDITLQVLEILKIQS